MESSIQFMLGAKITLLLNAMQLKKKPKVLTIGFLFNLKGIFSIIRMLGATSGRIGFTSFRFVNHRLTNLDPIDFN